MQLGAGRPSLSKAVRVEVTTEAVKQAWAHLASVDALARCQVLVDAESPLCPNGWIGILTVAETVTATVPRADLRPPVVAALEGLTAEDATDPHIVVPRLPHIRAVLGPAALFYPTSGFRLGASAAVDQVALSALEALLEAASPDEVDESGLRDITSPVFATRAPDGRVTAACGYRRWPNHVAHLSVLTHPSDRQQGHGRMVATAAIRDALDNDLLPQWRARPPASRALAYSLGLRPLGAQVSLKPQQPAR
jgi:GNAT acetyltransferase-like protein